MRTGDDPVRRTTRGEQHRAGTAEKGAALIELAMVLPLVVMLIVGMVSAGIAYNHQLALTHAAREGGRYAATLPVTNFGSMNLWLDEVVQQVVEDTTGSLAPGVPGYYICVAYVHPDGSLSKDSTTRAIDDGTGGPPFDYDNQACFSDSRPDDERRVQVEVGRDSDFDVVFFSMTVNLDAEAVNRFEAGVGF